MLNTFLSPYTTPQSWAIFRWVAMADGARRSIHGRQTVRFVRVLCRVGCLAIGTSQPKQRTAPNKLSQHVYDVGVSYPQEPRRQKHGNVKKSPHRRERLTHERLVARLGGLSRMTDCSIPDTALARNRSVPFLTSWPPHAPGRCLVTLATLC